MGEIDYKNEYFLKGGTEGCLLVHGITGTPAELRELGEKLNEKGYTVLGVKLKGHGTKAEDMLQCTYMDWVESAVKGFDKLKKECNRVYVIGHSMGALITLFIEENLKTDKIVLLSPPLIVKNRISNFAFIVKYFMKYSIWDSRSFTEEQEKYVLGYSKVPIKSVHELNKLRSKVKKKLNSVSCPTLMINSNSDSFVDNRSIDLLCNRISSAKKEKLFLDTSGHLIAVEDEKEKVFKAVIDFIKGN